MKFTAKQIATKTKIELISRLFEVDPAWATSIGMVESSLGMNQESPTGCLGVFNMSSIAMEDLRQSMSDLDNDLIDISCGVGFLRLLLDRWHTPEEATKHFCDPADRENYLTHVNTYMKLFKALEPSL